MKIIGLTGKTGAGKGEVCKILRKYGCYIIDTDKIAREIVEPCSPALKKLSEYFGEDIVDENGFLNRKLLAKRAFSDENKTKKLNEITHPFINEKVKEEIDFADKNGYGFCVIDAPVLLESDCKNFCDIIALVSASESLRLKRILLRDNISEDDAKIRIGAQKSDEYYEENSDIIIMNDKDDNLEEETKKLLKFAEEN